MKIWNVWFSDCCRLLVQLTSHGLFFFLFLFLFFKTCCGFWIIVWVWAFFFSSARLGSFHMGKFIWASETKYSELVSRNNCGCVWTFLKGPNLHGEVTIFRHLFWEIVFSCFPNLQSEIMIDANLIILLYNL